MQCNAVPCNAMQFAFIETNFFSQQLNQLLSYSGTLRKLCCLESTTLLPRRPRQWSSNGGNERGIDTTSQLRDQAFSIEHSVPFRILADFRPLPSAYLARFKVRWFPRGHHPAAAGIQTACVEVKGQRFVCARVSPVSAHCMQVCRNQRHFAI